MASVAKDGKGWRILFVAPDGKRKTLRLGRVDKKTAESIRVHMEALLAARISGLPVQQATAAWLNTIGETLKEKLARLGLIDLQPAASMTLKTFLEDYLARRTDAKPSTVVHWRQAARCLLAFFGPDRPLANISAGDALDFARWLKTSAARLNRYADANLGVPLSPNTQAKRIQDAKQFFQDAVERRLLSKNPFAKLSGTIRSNRTRDYFVTPEEAAKVMQACPDAEWRAMFALARWGALRCPSEILALAWTDVDWERGRLRVPSPKTAHHAGHAERIIPLFTEVRQALEELWDKTPEGTVYVINRYRSTAVNLRTQLERIVRRAGLKPWPKLWQNLRATRATELVRKYPQHVAAAWCGHTVQIADKHYWQVTEADYQRAIQYPSTIEKVSSSVAGNVRFEGGTESGTPVAQNAAQSVPAPRGKLEKVESQGVFNYDVVQHGAQRNLLLQNNLVGDGRLERPTSTL